MAIIGGVMGVEAKGAMDESMQGRQKVWRVCYIVETECLKGMLSLWSVKVTDSV